MTVLISHILPNGLPVFPAMLSIIPLSTAFAINPKSVPSEAIFVKLTFGLPLFTFDAAFLFHTLNRAVCFFIIVVFLCHYLLVLHSQTPLLTKLAGSFL